MAGEGACSKNINSSHPIQHRTESAMNAPDPLADLPDSTRRRPGSVMGSAQHRHTVPDSVRDLRQGILRLRAEEQLLL